MRLLIKSFAILALAATLNGNARVAILIKVDKSTQRMTVLRDGAILHSWPVSTGRTGFATPSGSYTTFRMEADHYSKEWDDAPMPHSIFFTTVGHAIHDSYSIKNLGTPVSHGCVRISPANATTLFALVKKESLSNTKVVLTGSEQIALARPDVQRPLDQNAGYRPYYARPNLNSQEDIQAESAHPLYVDRNGEYRPRDFVPMDLAKFRQQSPGYDADKN